MYALTDFTCMLLSVTVHYVESTVQDIEPKDDLVNFITFFLLKIF